jgi:hypothetical protein
MKFARRSVVVLAAILMTAATSFGQAVSQLPANSMMVLHIKSMSGLSAKIASWAKQMNLLDRAPMMADPLGAALDQGKLHQGLNKDGDAAVAWIAPTIHPNAPMPDMSESVLFLLPVSDYTAFLTNFVSVTTDGAVSTGTPANGGPPMYFAKWGDYAACSPIKDIVTGTPGGLSIGGLAGKELDAKDAAFVVNMKAVRPRILPLMIAMRPQALSQIQRGFQNGPMQKYSSLVRTAANEALSWAQYFVTDCDAVCLSVNMSDDGLLSSTVADFQPDSPWGQTIAQLQDTDKPLLAGLPSTKYLVLGGGVDDPKILGQIVQTIVTPVLPEIEKLGPDGKPFLDYIDAIEQAVASQNEDAWGIVAPTGELGTSPLFQIIKVTSGDAKTLQGVAQKMGALQDSFKAMMPQNAQMPIQSTFTAAAKTVDGIQFDQTHVGIDMTAATSPEAMRASQFLTFLYGQDGMNVYSGAVNDNTFLVMGGLSDDLMTATVEAAKTSDDSMDKLAGIQATAAHLPTQRLAEVYVPLDVLVNTGFSYAAKFGVDMGASMEASDPIGITLATDGSSVRIDQYMPSKLAFGIADVVNKVSGARHEGAPGAPPPGGGL